MLVHLTIRNYALIHSLEMDLSDHLNIITGETGTGKTIMLGALGLLMGNRADSKVLQDKTQKCIVEGTLNIADYNLKQLFETEHLDYANTTILRREVPAEGKSRAFINDTPVTLEVLKKIAGKLMNIHSQHDTMELKSQAFQLRIIDLYASNREHKEKYRLSWERFIQAQLRYETLQKEANAIQQEKSLIAYQLDELKEIDIKTIQPEELEKELAMMENAEDIKTRLNNIAQLLDDEEISADTVLSQARTLFHALSQYSETYAELEQRFESLFIELRDIVAEVRKAEEKIEYDPEKLSILQARSDHIHRLLSKHQCSTISELIEIKKNLQAKVDTSMKIDHLIDSAKKNVREATILLENSGKQLSQSRIDVFSPFCQQIIHRLRALGIPNARLKIAHTIEKPGVSGIDRIHIFFSANKGVEEQSLTQVASGGEFSRLMFCIQYALAKKTALPTLVLDEIDTGISGEIAIQMGNMMKTMAEQCQLLAISHLPQIAAKADRHFYVYKMFKANKTVSLVKYLETEERIDEIAKMIGGSQPSDSAKKSAKELMNLR